MSRRYFYKDPLAAAWMTRHHGFKIHGPVRNATGEIGESNRPMPVWILARAIEAAEKGQSPEDARYYLHAESVRLLEPQVGDWGVGPYAGEVISVSETLITIDVPERHNGKHYFCQPRSAFKVTSRKQTAFIWPEVEDI